MSTGRIILMACVFRASYVKSGVADNSSTVASLKRVPYRYQHIIIQTLLKLQYTISGLL